MADEHVEIPEPRRRQLTCILGLPSNQSVHPEVLISTAAAAERVQTVVKFAASSLLCHTFNCLWAQALNTKPRPDLFAMHHADLTTDPGWLDELVDEMHAQGADLISCVVAIKDRRGLTSTGLIDSETSTLRRVTAQELPTLPETFGAEELVKAWDLPGKPDRYALVVNTGLWVCKFEDWAERIAFEQSDRIEFDGKEFVARTFSEDWMFSAQLATMGKRVIATRKLQVIHYGITPYATGGKIPSWGLTAHDEWKQI